MTACRYICTRVRPLVTCVHIDTRAGSGSHHGDTGPPCRVPRAPCRGPMATPDRQILLPQSMQTAHSSLTQPRCLAKRTHRRASSLAQGEGQEQLARQAQRHLGRGSTVIALLAQPSRHQVVTPLRGSLRTDGNQQAASTPTPGKQQTDGRADWHWTALELRRCQGSRTS